MNDLSKAKFEEMEKYCTKLARDMLRRYNLARDSIRMDDIVQTLILAGWQVLKDTDDWGLAKHRMSTRLKNEEAKLNSELKKIQPEAAFSEKAIARGDKVSGVGFRREDPEPAEDSMMFDEFMALLPDDTRKVVRFKMADMTNEEVADELGIGVRTVERKLAEARELRRKYDE